MELPQGHVNKDGTGPIDYYLLNPADFGILAATIIWIAPFGDHEGHYRLEIKTCPRSGCGPSTAKTLEGNMAAFKSHVAGNRYLAQPALFEPEPKWAIWPYEWTKSI
jgi:hypothetical protein